MQAVYLYGISLGLTLVLELGLALFFDIRGKDLGLVILVNILTNPAVVLIHQLLPGFILGTILPEAAAVAAEALLYVKKKCGIRHPIRFAILANLFSYSVGELINLAAGLL